MNLAGSPAWPPPASRLCALAEIDDPGAKGFIFRHGDYLFAGFVVRQGEAVAGFVDRCPHAGNPLAAWGDRYLTREGDLIFCAAHGALFRPLDGLCIAGPCAGRALWPWPVRVEAGAVVTTLLSIPRGPRSGERSGEGFFFSAAGGAWLRAPPLLTSPPVASRGGVGYFLGG